MDKIHYLRHINYLVLHIKHLGVVYMNPDWVSIPNDNSNSIRVYMGNWVEDWKITENENLIPDWSSFQIHHSCTDNLIFLAILALIHLHAWIKLPILQTIFISAIINVDFIPSFIQDWNFDPSLHDSELTFRSGSSVQSGMKNRMNSIRNELQLIHVKRYNSIPYHLNRNGMSSIRCRAKFMTCEIHDYRVSAHAHVMRMIAFPSYISQLDNNNTRASGFGSGSGKPFKSKSVRILDKVDRENQYF